MPHVDAAELRAIQVALKDRYRTEPKANRITLRASGALDSAAIACKVETGKAIVAAGLHPAAAARNFARATCCSRHWSPAPA